MIIDVNTTEYIEYTEKVKKEIAGKRRLAHIATFGCQQNSADSEKLCGMAEAMGYDMTSDPDEADLVILNTCAIRRHAEEKALSMLGRFKAKKRREPSFIIGVCGCMAAEEHIKELIKNDFHYVSFTLEPNMIHKLPEVLYKALADSKRSFILGEDRGDIAEGLPTVRSADHKAWVSIMYGCNNFCSYCIVPYVRGRERSRDTEEILSECRELISSGAREITLLGQNVNSYKGECDFPILLERIANIEGDFIIRFMTSHPKDASDRLIEVMGKYSPKIAPYFHLPLQSGSNAILKRMNRTYTRERFISIVEKLRAEVPDVCLSTDVIVGFPGETDADFLDTVDILKRAEFDMVYAFKYSPRDGTPAAKMPDQIPEEIKDERIATILREQDIISLNKNSEYVGRTVRVLVDSVSKRKGFNTVSARTYSNKLVHFEASEVSIGTFKTVKITKAGVYDLVAAEIKQDNNKERGI